MGIVGYTVVRCNGVLTLVNEVKKLIIESGWEPIGGIAFQMDTSNSVQGVDYYCQAMILKEKTNEKGETASEVVARLTKRAAELRQDLLNGGMTEEQIDTFLETGIRKE